MTVALSPQARAAGHRRGWPTAGELDVLVVGGGVVGAGSALDAATRGLPPAWSRPATSPAARRAGPASWCTAACATWRCSTSRLVHEALQERGLLLQRLAPHLVKPVPFLYPLQHRVLGAALRRRPASLLYDAMAFGSGPGAGAAAAPAPDPARRAAQGAVAAARTRWSARCSTTTPRSTTPGTRWSSPGRRRRTARWSRPGSRVDRLPAAGRAGHRRAGQGPRDRPRVRGPGQAGDQRDRRLDRRHPGDGGRARPVPRPGVARASTWWCRRTGSSPATGLILRTEKSRAVRHPVGPALDHRHHRHRLGAGQGPPGGDQRGHRLPARPRQRRAA